MTKRPPRLGDNHIDWCIVKNEGNPGRIPTILLLIVVETVRIAAVGLPRLSRLVNKPMRHYFQEVEVVLGDILRLVLETLVDATVLHKHIENGVLSIVDLAKMLLDVEEIVSIAKC